jgi:hypothetical protein
MAMGVLRLEVVTIAVFYAGARAKVIGRDQKARTDASV